MSVKANCTIEIFIPDFFRIGTKGAEAYRALHYRHKRGWQQGRKGVPLN